MDVARALLAVAGPDLPGGGVPAANRLARGLPGRIVFDMVFGHPQGTSISAVQLLQEANAQGIPLYLLTSQTLPGALPQLQLDADVLADIRTAVDTGKTVLVSAREVVRDRWTGVGYVIQDPATGAGAYLLQGGWRGGEEMGVVGSPSDPCSEGSLEPNAQPIHDFVFGIVYSPRRPDCRDGRSVPAAGPCCRCHHYPHPGHLAGRGLAGPDHRRRSVEGAVCPPLWSAPDATAVSRGRHEAGLERVRRSR